MFLQAPGNYLNYRGENLGQDPSGRFLKKNSEAARIMSINYFVTLAERGRRARKVANCARFLVAGEPPALRP